MKSADIVEMTIDIGGELLTLDVEFDEQNNVRDTERSVKNLIANLKKEWPENSDRNILAMALYQLAKSFHQNLKTQEDVLDITRDKIQRIDNFLADPQNLSIYTKSNL